MVKFLRLPMRTNNLLYRAKWFFLEKLNFCHPKDRNGNDKPETLFYKAYCFLFWPIPWQETPCWCCASFRGLVTGFILGVALCFLVM